MSATRIVRMILAEELSEPVYAVVIPQTEPPPAIVVSTIHEAQDYVLDGSREGFFARVSIECLATSVAECDQLGEAVKAALGDVVARRVYTDESPPDLIGEATLWKEGTDLLDYADDRSIFRRVMDYRLRWTK